MQGMPTTTPKRGATSIRLTPQLVEDLRVVAQANHRSWSAEVRHALDAYVRRELPAARRALAEREQR